jgi:hypothetical protein
VDKKKFERELLPRRWVQAAEEEGAGEMVFRPAEHSLPPARGRLSLELREDGGLTERQPGPADAPEEAEGSWELRDDELVLRRGGGPERRLRLRALERDRLVVER